MGKRAILAAVLFWLLVAGLQVWLLSAILSRPLPSGKTGWEVIAAEQAKRRSSNMPLVEGVSIAYKCGNAVYGSASGDDTIYLRLNGPSPGLSWCTVTVYFSAGENTIWIGETTGYGPFPEEVDCPLHFNAHGFDPVPSGQYELQWISAGTGSRPSGSTGLFLSIDTTSLPTFTTYTSYECNPDGIGVAEWTVSARVDNQPSSWSYELYDAPDATGNRIYAGSVNSPPSPPECSATMRVTGIPSYPFGPESIKLIATNANGTAETVVNLFPPVPESARISADPTGILEGQDVTLNWSVGAKTSSAEIDNGIGRVYWAVTSTETSGSVTVSPTETTTYTITAYGGCAEVTASVTVYVQAVPRVQSAMIRLIAQEGLASTKTAKLDQSAKIRLIANDLDRRTHHKVAGHRFNIQPAEERTPHEKVAGHRFNVRAERRKVSGHRFDVRATRTKVAGHRFRVLYPDRMHVYARNTATGAVLDLGAIEMDAAELVLTDVAIAPGTYEFWTERQSTFWKGCRPKDIQVVRLAADEPPVVGPLPAVVNLAASVVWRVTNLSWDVSHPVPEDGIRFGIWRSETSPVDTTGAPAATVRALTRQSSYEARWERSGEEYVAVALRGSDGTLGESAELYLPWSETPNSPANQTVGG